MTEITNLALYLAEKYRIPISESRENIASKTQLQ